MKKQPQPFVARSLMIETASIQNFRCLESIDLKACRHINLVVGGNGTGKTSLLEALFLTVGGSAEIAARFRIWRGFEAAMGGSLAQIDDALFGALFNKFDKTKTIHGKITGTDNHTREIEVSYGVAEPTLPIGFAGLSVSAPPGVSTSGGKSAVTFKWTRSDGSQFEMRPQLTPVGFQFPGADEQPLLSSYFPANSLYSSVEAGNRFSNLSRRREADKAIEAIKKIFPIIHGIDLQTHAGLSIVHADILSLPEKVPLSGVSSGISKFATILFAIAESKKTMVFVDEFENGFYHELLPDIWRTYREFCEESGVQIFASTHSRECILALAKAAEKHPDSLSLIRTNLKKDGTTELEQFVGKGAISAMQHGEVR